MSTLIHVLLHFHRPRLCRVIWTPGVVDMACYVCDRP